MAKTVKYEYFKLGSNSSIFVDFANGSKKFVKGEIYQIPKNRPKSKMFQRALSNGHLVRASKEDFIKLHPEEAKKSPAVVIKPTKEELYKAKLADLPNKDGLVEEFEKTFEVEEADIVAFKKLSRPEMEKHLFDLTFTVEEEDDEEDDEE